MDSRGLSLVELLVGIAIIAIVMMAVGFEFFGWQARYKVESEIKELEATFMDSRIRARQKNRTYFILCDKSSDNARRSYVTYEDDGDDRLEFNGEDVEVGDLTKRGLPYRLDWNAAKVGATFAFAVDTKGFVGLRTNPYDATPASTLQFPEPSTFEEGKPQYIKMWLVNPEGKRYIPADIPDPDDLPDVSYDCVMVTETRVNIGKLDDGGNSCDEK